MTVALDKFELMYFLEGCIIGSHLRQGVWGRAINEFYGKLNNRERNFVYHYSVRDLMGRESNVSKDDFASFIARYNPYNQYKVTTIDGKTHDTYKYKGKYHIGDNTYISLDSIVSVEKDEKRLSVYEKDYGHLQHEINKKL